MIYATGFVTIIGKQYGKQIGSFKRKTLVFEKIEETIDNGTLKIKFRFTAYLPRSFECRTLEDYTGKIKPFIERQITSIVLSVQVTHLNYVSEEAIRRLKNK